MKFLPDRNQQEGVDEEVVKIKHPPCPTKKYNPIVLAGQCFRFMKEPSFRHARSFNHKLELAAMASTG